jgi:chromosome partitioning protein
LLIPVQTEFLALKGLERMLRTLSMILRARQRPLEYMIIPTMFDRRTRASLESLKSLKQQHPYETWKSVIPVDTQFREASRQGLPLSYLNPQSRGAIAYATLLDTLLGTQERSAGGIVK